MKNKRLVCPSRKIELAFYKMFTAGLTKCVLTIECYLVYYSFKAIFKLFELIHEISQPEVF